MKRTALPVLAIAIVGGLLLLPEARAWLWDAVAVLGLIVYWLGFAVLWLISLPIGMFLGLGLLAWQGFSMLPVGGQYVIGFVVLSAAAWFGAFVRSASRLEKRKAREGVRREFWRYGVERVAPVPFVTPWGSGLVEWNLGPQYGSDDVRVWCMWVQRDGDQLSAGVDGFEAPLSFRLSEIEGFRIGSSEEHWRPEEAQQLRKVGVAPSLTMDVNVRGGRRVTLLESKRSRVELQHLHAVLTDVFVIQRGRVEGDPAHDAQEAFFRDGGKVGRRRFVYSGSDQGEVDAVAKTLVGIPAGSLPEAVIESEAAKDVAWREPVVTRGYRKARWWVRLLTLGIESEELEVGHHVLWRRLVARPGIGGETGVLRFLTQQPNQKYMAADGESARLMSFELCAAKDVDYPPAYPVLEGLADDAWCVTAFFGNGYRMVLSHTDRKSAERVLAILRRRFLPATGGSRS